jgi:hypothetical protein
MLDIKPEQVAGKDLCFENKDLVARIGLYQNGVDSFCVTYGMQIRDNLTYEKACSELGAAFMHALACEGLLDNREPGEEDE